MFTVKLPAALLAQLARVVEAHVIECGAKCSELNAQRVAAETIEEARAQMTNACLIYSAIVSAESVEFPAPAEIAWESQHTEAELKGTRDAGLDPLKELGPHDPRARDPSCAHGRKFSEDCDECARPSPVVDSTLASG